jgi:hypothetical protein
MFWIIISSLISLNVGFFCGTMWCGNSQRNKLIDARIAAINRSRKNYTAGQPARAFGEGRKYKEGENYIA